MIANILEQMHYGKTHVGEYLSSIFQGLPVFITWKDSQSVCKDGNAFFPQIIGYASMDDIIGRTDFDFLPTTEAELFVSDDQEVIKKCVPHFHDIRTANFSKARSIVEDVTKFPTYNENKEPNGIVALGIIISETRTVTVEQIYHLINSQKKILDNYFKNQNYYMILGLRTILLTNRQATVLTHLSMGKTIKQIANLLGCANTTIEDHIDRLKQKLEVYTTAALIECFWNNPIKWF